MPAALQANDPWASAIGDDCRNLDGALAEFLAVRLEFLATHGRSHPPGRTATIWELELRQASLSLREHATNVRCGRHDKPSLSRTTAALEWLSQNFFHLWD